jgi:acyl-CoA thioesterase-1
MTRAARPTSAGALRAVFLAALGLATACGSGKDVNNSNDVAEAKNNMSVVQGREDSAAAAVAGPRPAGKPVVLFFGTSLTAGLGLDAAQAFPSLIEKKAAAEGIPMMAVNAGLSRETTAGAARRIDWVLRTPADLVVIESGANDALRGLSPDAARTNIEELIAAVRQKQPRAKIALVQMEAPPNYGVTYTKSFHSIYPDVARKENVPLLPFLLDGVAGISRLNQADGMHPNLAGEQIVASNLWKGLRPIVMQLSRAGRNSRN